MKREVVLSRITATFFVLGTLLVQPVMAGTYVGVVEQLGMDNDIPYAIVHPMGYDGSGGTLQIDICVLETHPDDKLLVGPVQAAIDIWNKLEPTTGNCVNCRLVEDDLPDPPPPIDGPALVAHELGHCAMGLDRINLTETTDLDGDGMTGPSSYTRSRGATSITSMNSIKGDKDDNHLQGGNVDDFSWFRMQDNNPVIVDGLEIDKDSYSRSQSADLPKDSNYAASANKEVAASLGAANTQSLMYGDAFSFEGWSGLSADSVNLVKMAMTGADRDAATTGDNYDVHLRYIAHCDGSEEVLVEFQDLGPGLAGICFLEIQESFPQGIIKFHWTIVPDGEATAVTVAINSGDIEAIDFGELLYRSGFENGDLSEWDSNSP